MTRLLAGAGQQGCGAVDQGGREVGEKGADCAEETREEAGSKRRQKRLSAFQIRALTEAPVARLSQQDLGEQEILKMAEWIGADGEF